MDVQKESAQVSLSALNPQLLSRSRLSPFQFLMAFLASLAWTFRGHQCERGDMIITMKLQRGRSCVCTMLHMLALEGEQRFLLKAATGLSADLFHSLHSYWQILFFFPLPECQWICFFSWLLMTEWGRKFYFFEVLLSSYQVMYSNLCMDVILQYYRILSHQQLQE